jgi:hypothetical protein
MRKYSIQSSPVQSRDCEMACASPDLLSPGQQSVGGNANMLSNLVSRIAGRMKLRETRARKRITNGRTSI